MASPACCSLQCLSVKRVALFLLLVSVYASLFVSRLSDAGQVADRRDYSGGKRALLGLDEEVEEDPLPKKKKSLVSIKAGEETKVSKKEKVGAVTEGSVEEKPKKKKATVQDLDEENVTKKKKKLAAADADHADGDEKVPLKKNKKATTKTEEAEVDDGQLPKKKKKVAIDEEEEDQATQKKKKKPTLEELDEPKKKMTPQEAAAADTEEKPLKKKKITSNMVDNEEEVEEQFVKKKKKLAPMEDNEEEVEEQSLTKKKKKLAEEKTGKLAKPKNQTKSIKPTTNSTIKPAKPKTKLTTPKPGEGEDGDLITEFRDLPSKLATSIIPDLERISTTSKVYLKKANKEISQSFKPLVGPKYASLIASFASYLFLLAPIVIFPLLYARIRNYFFPLQTIVVFIHIYLAIYFSVLSLSYLLTGQEPLRFFYATSKASFVYTQLLQTMGYALYLLVLVVHLVVVFSSKDAGAAPRLVGLAQMMVGLAVGAHYYVAVAHRAVLREPPLTNWKVHAGYAALFVGVCLLARAERRKKAYLHEGGEEGKSS